MRLSALSATSILVCLFAATTAHALVMSYGHRQIAEAGVGCVGGWASDHGTVSYFRGDTTMLNGQLALLANGTPPPPSVKLVLHAGASAVDNPEETLIRGFDDQTRDQISIDWSVQKSCPFDNVRTGRCKCDEQRVTVHIWVANGIRLNDLIVPADFFVESAGEIDEFVKGHAVQK